MPEPTFVTTLLALFASDERANEIHGDLLEERARRGLAWYCLQVPLTCALLPAIGMFVTRNALLYGKEALEMIPIVVSTALISMLLVRWLQLRAAVRSGSDPAKPLQGS